MLRHEMFLLILPWMAFTYENIAKNKNAKQDHPYEKSPLLEIGRASRAIDGLKSNLSAFGGQCTLSANGKTEALLYVDLASVLGIHHITIYYRTDNKLWGPNNGYTYRFLGFSVYISNTTDREDGVLCFKDKTFTRFTIPYVLTLNCTHHGRYVIYYNNRTSTTKPADYSEYAFNELCEFEVYGCPNSTYYGESCNMPCPSLCKNGCCHIETGYCFGCEDGYLGSTCKLQCQNNTYGTGCSKICGHCLNREQCNHVNGTCHSGCVAGYYGARCKIECPPKLYGRNCLQNCSENCYMSKTCDKKTGVCDGGCKEGWTSPMCNEECDNTSYGSNCSYSCGHCQKGVPCNKKTGECPSGCSSGYKGIFCNKSK